MRRWAAGAVLSAVLVACAANAPAGPSLGPATAPLPDPSAFRSSLEARFGALMPGPAAPGSVWSPDHPTTLEARAFGAFPVDHQPGGILTYDRLRLAAALPAVPGEISVAVVGSYDESWKATVAAIVTDLPAWDVVPLYSSISSLSPVGPMPPNSPAGVAQARALLARRGLLLPDMEPHPHPGANRIEFIRHLDGLAIWTNNGVSLVGLTGGQSQALARRRPILAVSRYPLRTPDQAWTDLQQGRGQTMYVDDGAPAAPIHLAEFVVTSVELVYLEVQVIGPRELMQPYYAFRESGGSVLYVPAVAF